MLKLGCCFL